MTTPTSAYTGAVELPELVVTVCWYLWWQRRQLVRGDDVQTPERIAPAVIALAQVAGFSVRTAGIECRCIFFSGRIYRCMWSSFP